MLRIKSPWGRLYYAPVGIIPSVTTVLKETSPRPYSPTTWSKSVKRKGISPLDAELFEDYLQQLYEKTGTVPFGETSWGACVEHIAQMIESPVSSDDADFFIAWKSREAPMRGNRLHKRLEDLLVASQATNWTTRPVDEDRITDNLLLSLWKADVLQDIEFVHSVEKSVWYFSEGEGYAGSEDICYKSKRAGIVGGDWKSKDVKHYCPSTYSKEHQLQLIAYSGAKLARDRNFSVNGLAINYCFTDGSKGVQVIIDESKFNELWSEWKMRLRAWWQTIGPCVAQWDRDVYSLSPTSFLE